MVKYTIEEMNVTKNIIPEMLYKQCDLRLKKIVKAESKMTLAILTEPIWWNRPLEFSQLTNIESDGLPSLNLPYIAGEASYKTKYNLLLGTGCVAYGFNLDLSDINIVHRHKLTNLSLNAVLKTLSILGVPSENLSISNNDILYKGKKCVAVENRILENMFTENVIVTLNYEQEAEIFSRLTGSLALKRGIVGILDEAPLFTKEQFIETYITVHKQMINELMA